MSNCNDPRLFFTVNVSKMFLRTAWFSTYVRRICVLYKTKIKYQFDVTFPSWTLLRQWQYLMYCSQTSWRFSQFYVYSRMLLPIAHYGLLLYAHKNLTICLCILILRRLNSGKYLPSNTYSVEILCNFWLRNNNHCTVLCISVVCHRTKLRIPGCQYFYFP